MYAKKEKQHVKKKGYTGYIFFIILSSSCNNSPFCLLLKNIFYNPNLKNVNYSVFAL